MARPRTATALKLIKGTDQPCRTNKREPKPRRGIPSPPAHLSDRAKTAWGAVSVILDRMGVLTEADGLALEGACEAYAELVEARQVLKARGALSYETEQEAKSDLVISAKAGEVTEVLEVPRKKVMIRAFPEVAMIADADRRLAMWLTKLGMTPADRSRVSVIGGEETKDPWSNL